jgi:hypothetical protein
MQPLTLRPEFLARHPRATAIELSNQQNSGWAQRPDSTELLEITYPTSDVQRALQAVSASAAGRPVVFIGQRGRGKSHIMGLLHHAFLNPVPVESWAAGWSARIQSARLTGLTLQRGFLPITETMSNWEYHSLWDVIFNRHPKGAYYRGRFEQAGTPVPSKSLLQDLFNEQHTALILDELQTWFDGLHDEQADHGPKRRQWAFSFIQILSELATERPDLLCLVASVRDNSTEAYRQIHRVGPTLIDFKGETAREDRKRLVLHRLFENRDNFTDLEIEQTVDVYACERNRLLYSDKTDADKARLRQEVVACWPFAPELLSLLEDNILMADAAQSSRDLIRTLAEVYKVRGGQTPILTPSDFSIDDDSCGVLSLLDAMAASADQEQLREKARRNLQALRDASIPAPHALGVVSALWMRSLSAAHDAGGTRQEVQLDMTGRTAVDDNAFTAELVEILDNSFNIHEVGTTDKRFCFKLPENPVSKVKAWARNDRSFEPETAAPPNLLPVRKDQEHLRTVLNYLLKSPDSASQQPCVPIVLDPNWERAPWTSVNLQTDHPTKWDQRGDPVLIVLPVAPADASAVLGPWLVNNVPVNRNMVRFLLPKDGLQNIYDDRDLIISVRCAMLAKEWGESEPPYETLHKRRFYPELVSKLKERFDRYAILQVWDFQNPAACTFHVEYHRASGGAIPAAVEEHIKDNFFAPEDFEAFAVAAAGRGETMRQVLALLRSEPLPGTEAIPYLGENEVFEQILVVASQDKIALNVRGTWYCANAGESEEAALVRLRQKAWCTGNDRQLVRLGLPSQVGTGGVAVITPVVPPMVPMPPLTSVPLPDAPPSGGGPSVAIPPVVLPPGATDIVPVVPPQPSAPANPVIRQSMGAKTGMNLLGELEAWGYADNQRVAQAALSMADVTVKELRDLCSRMPPKIRAQLQITLPPEGDQP